MPRKTRLQVESLDDRCLPSFSPATSYSVGVNPQAISTADFNNDGHLDLATANAGDSNVSVRLGNGNGTFGPALTSATGIHPEHMAVGDFNNDGKLDLATNSGIVNYTGASPADTIRQQILSGRGGPGLGRTWNGQGITSSAAAAAEAETRSVGYAENATMPLGPLTTFRGQPVDDTTVLMAFTRTGDANLDGVVNDDDVTIVGATYAPGVAGATWARGDFDYNGFVDDDDVTLLGALYDPSATPITPPAGGVAAVPEPASLILSLLGAVGIGVLVRRRR